MDDSRKHSYAWTAVAAGADGDTSATSLLPAFTAFFFFFLAALLLADVASSVWGKIQLKVNTHPILAGRHFNQAKCKMQT